MRTDMIFSAPVGDSVLGVTTLGEKVIVATLKGVYALDLDPRGVAVTRFSAGSATVVGGGFKAA